MSKKTKISYKEIAKLNVLWKNQKNNTKLENW